ncbi:MAG TPA: GFA family protein [Aestuariivirgaceae bacterium]
MNAPMHSGHCLCGAVGFETSSEPLWVAYCHCASCRRHTGSAVAAFAGFDEQSVRFTRNVPAVYESSPDVWRSFCSICGSPISYRSRRFPNEVHFYVGVMDHPERYRPTAHVYFGEHLPWFDTRDELARHEKTTGR